MVSQTKVMKLRFVSWNVNNCNPTPRHVEILRHARPDILALQDVRPAFHKTLAAKCLFQLAVCSLTLRPPINGEGPARRLRLTSSLKSGWRTRRCSRLASRAAERQSVRRRAAASHRRGADGRD
jgi:hypothetical protein